MSKPRSSSYEDRAEKEIAEDESIRRVQYEDMKGALPGIPPPLHPLFEEALKIITETIQSKNHDYASTQDPFSNFIESAFSSGIKPWQSFEQLIGTKEARLRNLMLSDTKTPKNESILDTYKDRAVYAVLAYAYQLKEAKTVSVSFAKLRNPISYEEEK